MVKTIGFPTPVAMRKVSSFGGFAGTCREGLHLAGVNR